MRHDTFDKLARPRLSDGTIQRCPQFHPRKAEKDDPTCSPGAADIRVKIGLSAYNLPRRTTIHQIGNDVSNGSGTASASIDPSLPI